MDIQPHTASEFADAIAALMPPGEAWVWRQSAGLGWGLLSGPAKELERIDALAVAVLGLAMASHKPVSFQWRLVDYTAIAQGVMPGALVSTRKPLRAGFKVGQRTWSGRARYALVVTYSQAAGDAMAMRRALAAFKQAHMVIFYLADTGATMVELSDA